jgi:hypothetical protein
LAVSRYSVARGAPRGPVLVVEDGLGNAGADGCSSTNGPIADVGQKLQAELKVVREKGRRNGAVVPYSNMTFPL